MIEEKNTQDKSVVLGQYFTHPDICQRIVAQIDFTDAVAIEPSFGTGNFIRELAKKGIPVVGVELDETLFASDAFSAYPNALIQTKNFFDFKYDSPRRLIFVGNPPFRTPAPSLRTHKSFRSNLGEKFSVRGIREEAVFFILHTIDIIVSSTRGEGEIHYILPMSILKNNSKFYQRFKVFLKEQCEFLGVTSLESGSFDNVAQDLICLSLRVGPHPIQKDVLINGTMTSLDDFLGLQYDDIIPFQMIFKQTYLGSVPYESVLMSVGGESREHFRDRLCGLISDSHLNRERLYQHLQYRGQFHLKIFDKPFEDPGVQSKLDIILSYVANMKEKEGILRDFMDIENYKEINGRNEILFYFRCPRLKKGNNFVYELNPNPCPSFYFTGNPSHSSTDYFGYCSYDVNRNVSPGANRTVPIANIEDNLTDFFKKWWREHTKEPFSCIFEYIKFISTTTWYKRKKATRKRFYFGIPAYFVKKEERIPGFEIPEIAVPLEQPENRQMVLPI